MDLPRTDQADLVAVPAQQIHCGAGNAAGDTVSRDDEFCALRLVFFVIHLGGLPALIHREIDLVFLFQRHPNGAAGLHAAAKMVPLPALSAGSSPGFVGLALGGQRLVAHHGRQDHRLHHRAGEAVAEHEHGVFVFHGQIEGLIHHIDGLLQGRRRQHEHPEAAVAGGLRCLKIVLLGRLDRSDAGSAAHHVAYDDRQVRAGHPCDRLAHQRDTAAR